MPRFLLTLFNRREYLLGLNTGAKSEISDSDPDFSQVHADSWRQVPPSMREALPDREITPFREGLS